MRGKKAPQHHIEPDAKYSSETVTKLINYVMQDGKKTVARTIVYKAMEELGAKTKANPLDALEQALANAKPKIEVRSRRVGGANYQVPTPVTGNRQQMLAIRWLIQSMRSNRGALESWQVLARELIAAYNNEGNAVRKKDDVVRMADANKAFAHFSW